jgi:undecaprenyl-diphosphatase
MSELEALLLGIVQGLSEFLPISSSGHLIIVPWLQDYRFLIDNDSFNKTFDVALHAGTLIAAVWYFRAEVVLYLRAFFATIRKNAIEQTDEVVAWSIAVGTVPAVIIGGLGESFFEDHAGQPWMIGIQLIVFGALLLWADSLPERRELDDIKLRDGLLIGLAQVLALFPGTSRSGITITAGRYFGLDRESAAKISFLLLIPVVFGATIYKAAKVIKDGLPPDVAGPLIVGTIASAVVGYIAIAFLLRYVQTHSYKPFVWYRFAVGAAVLIVIATGLRPSTF